MKKKGNAGHHEHPQPGTGANTWREYFQRQEAIEQTLIQTSEKKNHVTVLAGVQTMLKHLEPLSSKRIKQHLTVGEQAEGRVWCQMQHLVPAPWLCPESHPRTGARLFSQFGEKQLLVIFSQNNVIGCCPESLLWSYVTPLCHSCAQTLHF